MMLADVMMPVRVAAKELTSLVLDEERLRAERQDRKSWKSRVSGIEEFGPHHGESSGATRPKRDQRGNRRTEEEDLEFKLALEASKNEAEEDRKRRARMAGVEDDDDLAKAIKLSKEEEELRRKQLEEQNAQSLFDDTPTQQTSQPTGWNQGYQQQGQVDWFGNLIDQQQQQPQNTGFLNNAYAQPQQTGINGMGYGYQQQPQQTGFDQFGQQSFMQPQQTAFGMNNPYGQQQQPNGFGAFGQQQPQLQTQPEQQSTLQPGTHNPWASNQTSGLDSLKAQPTGSNNPFAQSTFSRPQPATQQSAPTLGAIQEQKTQTQFNNQNFNPPVSFSTPQPAQQQKPQDPHHARLNALLASGEGQDTFGNVGDLRIPAQHTAPGTFVNSAGAGSNRLLANATGTNPFMHQQFTGMPQTRMIPAQTGPAGGFGGNNPFGRPQTGNPQQQSGSLIDL